MHIKYEVFKKSEPSCKGIFAEMRSELGVTGPVKDSSVDRTSLQGLSPVHVTHLTRPVRRTRAEQQVQQLDMKHFTRSLLLALTFSGDKLERVAEYSKTRYSLLWTVVYKLVA